MGGLIDSTWEGDGKHTYMTPGQVGHLSELGYEIGSHTVTHSSLTALHRDGRYVELSDQIYHSKEKLEIVTCEEVTSFAYPNGSSNKDISRIVSEVYRVAVSASGDSLQTEGKMFSLGRRGLR